MQPTLIPMQPGERPSEPGIYLCHHLGSPCRMTTMVEVDRVDGPTVRLAADWGYEADRLVFDARVILAEPATE